jgi:hypothetical protein
VKGREGERVLEIGEVSDLKRFSNLIDNLSESTLLYIYIESR